MKRSAMALKKTECLFALTLFGVFLQAHGGETAKSSANAGAPAQNQTSPRPDSQQTNETVVPAPSGFKVVFAGSINKHAVRMELERKGADLTGYYFYERGAFQEALILHGRIDGGGNVTLAETSYDTGNPQKTGEFKGKLDGLSANGDVRLRFSGSWTGAKDGKQMPFSLQESEFDRFVSDLNLDQLQFDLGGLKLSKKRAKSADKKLCYKLVGETPQLVGGDAARTEPFNKAVADIVARYVNPFKKEIMENWVGVKQEDKSTAPPCNLDAEYAPGGDDADLYLMRIDYEVTAANKDFISLIFYFHEYGGPGTGFHWSDSFNYDLNRSMAIKLPDLFTPNSNYLKVISNYTIRELKKVDRIREVMERDPGTWLEKGAGPKSANFRSWNIIPAGLRITFGPQQFEVAANTGFNEVVIPYSVLKSVIKPGGLLARFAK